MTTPFPPEIPLLRVRGTHRQVGRQVGEACSAMVAAATDLSSAGVPRGGRTLDELLAEAARCRAITTEALPWLIDELDGVAEGAGVDPEALFAASMEELWDSRPSQPGDAAAAAPSPGAPGGGRTVGRCTDVLVSPAGTSSGHVLVGHNNDLSPDSEGDLLAIEWAVDGEPVVFSIGIGPWLSVGWNAAGLSLTGNEVSPNDDRSGIPRLLLVRAQLCARDIDEAVGLAVHPRRASAYNTVFADSAGRAVNVEASATDCECSGPDERGAIVHTNHYVSARMAAYEDDPEYAVRSARRRDRVLELLDRPGALPVDERGLRAILSDHGSEPDAICRHPAPGTEVKTVFWCVADVTEGRIGYGRGNPCHSLEQRYAFAG